jgi:ATPase subunit of ABC transporter with duplicated ATPase domains
MPASLHARGLRLSLGSRQILDDVDIAVDPGQRIGLVGPNGVGKSTLLKVLAGLVPPDDGSITLGPSDATVGYLPQEPERGSETVATFVARRTGVAAANVELDAATADLAAAVIGADDRYSAALDRWLSIGAADFDARVADTWESLGLPPRLLDQSMASLSGGEAARVGLAAVLLARFDVFLFDEPTNDLDLDGLDRLERFVTSLAGGAVIVSHDRTFLERTVTHVIELDEFTHRASRYAGGWNSYLREQQLAREHARRAFEEYDTKRATLAARSQREREWASQGTSKAKKGGSDGDKHIKSFKLNSSEQLAGKAARTEKAMERLEVVDEPREAWQLRLVFATTERSGDLVARLDDAVVERGDFRLGPINVEIAFGERVVIVGHNGGGKSTLVQALLGRTPLDHGSCRVGSGVVVGELEQTRHQLDQHPTMLAAFLDETGMTISDARTLLAKFGLRSAHVDRPTSSLSPGERTRLVLALLMARGVNCLILDEPTNHLDLPAIEQLEQALDTFPGTVILISHDRALLQAMRRTRTLTMDRGQLVADESA